MSDNRGRRFLRALMKYIERSHAPTAARLDQIQREMRAFPTMGHVQAVVKEEFAKVQAIKGEDGRSVTVEDVRPLIESLSARLEVEVERRVQERVDRIIGSAQEKIAQIDDIDARLEAKAARFEADFERRMQDQVQRGIAAGIEIAIAKMRQPKDGASIESVDITMEGRTLTFSMKVGDEIIRRSFKIPTAHDAGVYKSGQAYEEGGIVTFGGSAFIATRDAGPDEKPEASSAWRLLVKRGRDGK